MFVLHLCVWTCLQENQHGFILQIKLGTSFGVLNPTYLDCKESSLYCAQPCTCIHCNLWTGPQLQFQKASEEHDFGHLPLLKRSGTCLRRALWTPVDVEVPQCPLIPVSPLILYLPIMIPGDVYFEACELHSIVKVHWPYWKTETLLLPCNHLEPKR